MTLRAGMPWRVLLEIAQSIAADLPTTLLSDDQPFRQTTLAFERPASRDHAARIVKLLDDAGASVTLNSIWVLGWFGGYDKLSAARRFLPEVLGLDVGADIERIVYVGDSGERCTDVCALPKSAGVSTVTEHLNDIPRPPTWITRGPGGDGFVEVAEAILRARQSLSSSERPPSRAALTCSNALPLGLSPLLAPVGM